MKNSILFLSVFFVVLVASAVNVSSQDACFSPGDVVSGRYCDVDGFWKNLKSESDACDNSFECVNGQCVNGFCGDKFEGITNRTEFFEDLFSRLFTLSECTPGKDDCSGTTLVRTCGATGFWEDKNAQVDGRCGYSSNTPGGGSCDPNWTCTSWSDSTHFCGVRTCTDTKNCNTLRNKPEVSRVCPGSSPRCGDGSCDVGETTTSCPQDCKEATGDVCGNNICEASESSLSCPADCKAEEKSNWWIWIIVGIVILLILIALIIMFVVSKKKKDDGEKIKPFEKNKSIEKPVEIKPVKRFEGELPKIDELDEKPKIESKEFKSEIKKEPVIEKKPELPKQPHFSMNNLQNVRPVQPAVQKPAPKPISRPVPRPEVKPVYSGPGIYKVSESNVFPKKEAIAAEIDKTRDAIRKRTELIKPTISSVPESKRKVVKKKSSKKKSNAHVEETVTTTVTRKTPSGTVKKTTKKKTVKKKTAKKKRL